MTAEAATRVFVFGTLKEGFPNFATNRGRRVPGLFATVQRYPLVLIGERHSPWLLDAPGEGEHVSGQLFDVAPDVLAQMDRLERVTEPDGYRRLEIRVRAVGAADGETAQSVQAYLKHPRLLDGAMIMAGPLAEYTPVHAALYRSRA